MLRKGSSLSSPEVLFSEFHLASRQAVIAAVSGGSDSLALLFLLLAFTRDHAPDVRVVAVTVDHGLRPESAAEARCVAELCGRLGVTHRTVRWNGAKPASGIADAARLARYRLLADAASEAGTDLILTGHTGDDQAETVAMRADRGEGRGLAGMARATRYDGRVWVLRPLLGERRQAMRDMLIAAGQRWIDDPSNTNPAAERVRVRKRLSAAPAEVDRLIALAGEAAIIRRDLGIAAAALIALGRRQSLELVWLPATFFDQATDAAIYALRILLAAIGGMPQLPDLDRASGLFERLRAGPTRATLSRTLVQRRGTDVYLHREARGLPPPAMYGDGSIWDRRFRFHAPGEILVEPVGEFAMLLARPFGFAPSPRIVDAVAATPAFDASVGYAWQPRFERLVTPWALFLPDFDIAPNNATATLLGAPLTPSWP